MRKFNISGKLIDTIQSLYENGMSAVLVQGAIREWFHTSVGSFVIFFEDIMTHTLENNNGTISIGGGGSQTSVLPMTLMVSPEGKTK